MLPRGAATALAAAYGRSVLSALALTCGLKYVVEGQEHIPDTPSVVYLRHESAWETIAELAIFPAQCWVLKKILLWVPFLGWGLKAMDSIAIDRKAGHSALQQVVEQGKDRLGRGIWVMIFPEGTRMAPDQTRRYGLSGAVLALEYGCNIVPVAHNAGDFWPKNGFNKKSGLIRLCIGPPIHTQGRTAEEINISAKQWIDQKVAEIRTESDIQI